jgi:hypothetical protein
VQEADHSQEIEKREEEGRKGAGGFGEIGENCDFTASGGVLQESLSHSVKLPNDLKSIYIVLRGLLPLREKRSPPGDTS